MRRDPKFSAETAQEYALDEGHLDPPSDQFAIQDNRHIDLVSAIYFGMRKVDPTGEPMFFSVEDDTLD